MTLELAKRPSVWSLLATMILAPGLTDASAQAGLQVQRLPSVVGSFRLVDTATSVDLTVPQRFRYVDSIGTHAHVVLSPIPSTRASESEALTLEREGGSFLRSLATRGDGRHAAYQVIVDTVRTVETESGAIPVRIIAFVHREGESTLVSFAHFCVLSHHYLEVRLTLPSHIWSKSSAPNFALDFIQNLHRLPKGRLPL